MTFQETTPGFHFYSGSLHSSQNYSATDTTHGSRVVLHYKDGTKHTFKKVNSITLEKNKSGDRTLTVFGERRIINQIEPDITECGWLSYNVAIPAHYVKSYVVYSNSGIGKEAREVKL